MSLEDRKLFAVLEFILTNTEVKTLLLEHFSTEKDAGYSATKNSLVLPTTSNKITSFCSVAKTFFCDFKSLLYLKTKKDKTSIKLTKHVH